MFAKTNIVPTSIVLLLCLLLTACGIPAETALAALPSDSTLPTSGSPTEPTLIALPTNTPFPAIGRNITIDLPEGNSDDGRLLNPYCTLCHGGLPSQRGPNFASSAGSLSVTERASERLEDPAYTGSATNVQEYLIESIVDPLAYLVPGDWAEEDLMIHGEFGNFDKSLTAQNVADLIAWMYTLE